MANHYELTVSQAAQQIKDKNLSPVDLAQSLQRDVTQTPPHGSTDKQCASKHRYGNGNTDNDGEVRPPEMGQTAPQQDSAGHSPFSCNRWPTNS